MSLVALCSLKGSPGVTTTAVALADRWPAGGRPVVVECDPAGGDLLARFRLPLAPGLVSLAAVARRGATAGLLWQHTQTLPGGLAVVAGPVGAEQAHAALGEITGVGVPVLRHAADDPGAVVVTDCGRLGPGSPTLAVVRAADVVLVLARPHDDQLAHVAADLRLVERWAGRRCLLLLVGDGYATGEVGRTLGAVVLGRLPHDPVGAAVACGQRRSRRGPSRTPLGRAVAPIAAATASHAHPRVPAPATPAAPATRAAAAEAVEAAARFVLPPASAYPAYPPELPSPLAAESRNGHRP